METVRARPGDTLARIGKRFGITTVEMIKANPTLKNPDKIAVGQIINVPSVARHPPGGASPPSGASPADQASRAANAAADPTSNPKYVENAVVAVGLPIWGGPFYLYRSSVNGHGRDPVVIARNEAVLNGDPLKAATFELRSIYASKSEAQTAVAIYKMPGSYSYYWYNGLVLPTVISDTTAPTLCTALRQAVAQEQVDARAARDLSVQLALWYLGARLPIKAGEGPAVAPAVKAIASADAVLSGFSSAEQGVILEVRGMMKAADIAKIRQAYASGTDVVIKIGSRTIQYEPALKASGMTMFGEDGFLVGREAFTSEQEFVKTLLHETYRLVTSVSRTEGVSAATAKVETDAALDFSNRAYAAVMAGL